MHAPQTIVLTCSDSEAKYCKDLHEVMKRDFWVTTPCHSTVRPGHVMEGTRLTLQVSIKKSLVYVLLADLVFGLVSLSLLIVFITRGI